MIKILRETHEAEPAETRPLKTPALETGELAVWAREVMWSKVYGSLEGPFHRQQLSACGGHPLLSNIAYPKVPARPLPGDWSKGLCILAVPLGTAVPTLSPKWVPQDCMVLA